MNLFCFFVCREILASHSTNAVENSVLWCGVINAYEPVVRDMLSLYSVAMRYVPTGKERAAMHSVSPARDSGARSASGPNQTRSKARASSRFLKCRNV